jgi:hypothetical protein
MSESYHAKQRPGQRFAHQPEWLLRAYCHARSAGVPCRSVDEFCQRHLPLLPLGDKLTTTAVITALIWPGYASKGGSG